MKNIYQECKAKLSSQEANDLLLGRELPKVRYVDLYKGQYLSPELFDVMPLPAVLIEWSINHIDETATLSLHLVYEQLRDTSSLSASPVASLKFFDYINTIHELINGLESVNTGKLEPAGFSPIQLDRVATAHMLNYQCSYQDILDKIDPYTYTDGNAELELTKHIVKYFDFEN